MALHPDLGRHPRHPPDRSSAPSCPSRRRGARRRQRGHAEAAEPGRDLPGDLRRTTIVTTIMFACSYGAAFGAIQHLPRIVPGLAEVSALPRPDQQKVVSAVQALAGDRRPRRPRHPRLPRRAHRGPPDAAAHLPGARASSSCRSCSCSPRPRPRAAQVGHLPRRPPDRRPVQLLGQLPAAGLPDPPARHGRELRRQRRAAG